MSFDENSLTDQDILCYYAYSRLYTGDTDKQKDLLADKCGKEPIVDVTYLSARAIAGEDSDVWPDECTQLLSRGGPDSDTPLTLPAGLSPSCAPYTQSTTNISQIDKGHLAMSFSGTANRVNVPWACDPPSPNCYYAVYSNTGGLVSGRILTAGTYTVEMSLSPAFNPSLKDQQPG